MKFASVLLIVFSTVAVPTANAQDSPGQCDLNDSKCLESQVVRQCRDLAVATVQSCTAWIQSIQSSARAEDRVAKSYIAAAHNSIALLLPADAGEKLRHRNLARDAYAELVEQDGRDIDALLGMASAAESELERIDLLRKIASIAPRSFGAEQLADALARRGGGSDTLEAAEVLEAFYRLSQKGTDWDIAARAVRLYERAGTSDRNRYFRDRIREELGVASLVAELQRIPETTSARAAQILGELCDTSAVSVLGASACLDGLSEMSGSLTRLSGRADALGSAEIVARQIWSMGTIAGWEPVTRDAAWRGTISRIFLEMESRSIESPVILASRAMLAEVDPAQKLRLLDRATQLAAPNDSATLRMLADQYMVTSSRPTEALALFRRVQQLLPATDSQRKFIDHNIEALEKAEQASRESGAAR